jgi:hypothetical protein
MLTKIFVQPFNINYYYLTDEMVLKKLNRTRNYLSIIICIIFIPMQNLSPCVNGRKVKDTYDIVWLNVLGSNFNGSGKYSGSR